jgi:hypothetical protein
MMFCEYCTLTCFEDIWCFGSIIIIIIIIYFTLFYCLKKENKIKKKERNEKIPFFILFNFEYYFCIFFVPKTRSVYNLVNERT